LIIFGTGNPSLVQARQLFASNEIYKQFLLSSPAQGVQCILDYPAMLGNLFPKSWPDKKSIYRRVPTVHHLHYT